MPRRYQAAQKTWISGMDCTICGDRDIPPDFPDSWSGRPHGYCSSVSWSALTSAHLSVLSCSRWRCRYGNFPPWSWFPWSVLDHGSSGGSVRYWRSGSLRSHLWNLAWPCLFLVLIHLWPDRCGSRWPDSGHTHQWRHRWSRSTAGGWQNPPCPAGLLRHKARTVWKIREHPMAWPPVWWKTRLEGSLAKPRLWWSRPQNTGRHPFLRPWLCGRPHQNSSPHPTRNANEKYYQIIRKKTA